MLNPEFVGIDLALAIHDDLIETFGGNPGVLDLRLLDSALSQPQATFFGGFLHPTIESQAAAYLYHLAKGHCFQDGNKRTAVAVMQAFLGMNNYGMEISDDSLYDLVLQVTLNKIDKDSAAALIKQHLIPPSISNV